MGYNTEFCALRKVAFKVVEKELTLKGIGIKYQLRMTTLIPVFFIALFFAIFYNIQFNHELEQQTAHLGEAYVRQLLPAAELALMKGDRKTLQGLTDASIVNEDVESLAFYDTKGYLLAYRGAQYTQKNALKLPRIFDGKIKTKQLDRNTINFLAQSPCLRLIYIHPPS